MIYFSYFSLGEPNYKSHTIASKKNMIPEADLDYFSIEN